MGSEAFDNMVVHASFNVSLHGTQCGKHCTRVRPTVPNKDNAIDPQQGGAADFREVRGGPRCSYVLSGEDYLGVAPPAPTLSPSSRGTSSAASSLCPEPGVAAGQQRAWPTKATPHAPW